MTSSSACAQTAYELRAIFRNITGTAACYGYPAGGSSISGECATSSNGFYFLPSPAITSNASQRLTTIRWFLNAGNSDVRCCLKQSSDPSGANNAVLERWVVASGGRGCQVHHAPCTDCIVQASNLFNLPLTFSLDESSTDITQWRTFNFVYCHQVRPNKKHFHWKLYASILQPLPHHPPGLAS